MRDETEPTTSIPDDDAAFSILRASGPYQTVAATAKVIRGSRSKAYQLAHAGRLEFVKLDGKTLVRTESIVAYLLTAQPWAPSDNAAKALAARKARRETNPDNSEVAA